MSYNPLSFLPLKPIAANYYLKITLKKHVHLMLTNRSDVPEGCVTSCPPGPAPTLPLSWTQFLFRGVGGRGELDRLSSFTIPAPTTANQIDFEVSGTAGIRTLSHGALILTPPLSRRRGNTFWE